MPQHLLNTGDAEADELAKAIGLVTASAVQDGFEAGWAAGMKSVEKTESD